MDEADIYYVDTRNADPRDHRVGGVARPATVMPARAVVPPAGTPRATYPGAPPMVYAQPQVYAQPPVFAQPQVYAQPQVCAYPPMYGQPPVMTALGALFGGINIGQVIDLVGQGFAALKSLPAAPASTGNVATDVANLTLYQRALAEHGKLDEQIRTGAHIAAKLLGA